MTKPKAAAVTAAQCTVAAKKIAHFFHLAAIYDLTASAESRSGGQYRRHPQRAGPGRGAGAGCFRQFGAAAGLYPGVFREDMFDEAEGLDDPYLRTKHDSKASCARRSGSSGGSTAPAWWSAIRRPARWTRSTAPYYFFTLLKRCARSAAVDADARHRGGRINMVPVDFVVDAMDHIAQKAEARRHCFHLTDPEPMRVGGAQHLRPRRPCAGDDHAHRRAHVRVRPGGVRMAVGNLPPVRRFIGMLLRDFGSRADVL